MYHVVEQYSKLVYERDRSGSGWIDLSGGIVVHFDAIPKAAIHDRLQRVESGVERLLLAPTLNGW